VYDGGPSLMMQLKVVEVMVGQVHMLDLEVMCEADWDETADVAARGVDLMSGVLLQDLQA
jgi:hypothetical protein